MREDNLRRFCLLKLTKRNKTWKPIDSNICHVWTECLNHSLNTNWVLAGKQVHISEMVYLKNILRINAFYLFQTFMLIQARASLKAERRKLLEREGLKILVRKLCHYYPSMKPWIFDFSFPFIALINSVNQSYTFFLYNVSNIIPVFFFFPLALLTS